MTWTRRASFRVVATRDEKGMSVGPVGQPRVKAYRRGETTGVYTPHGADKWKALVAAAWEATGIPGPLDGPFRLSLVYRFQRPRRHYTMKGRGKNLRYDAPTWNDQRGRWDIDNCNKAVLDALTVDPDDDKKGNRPWANDAFVVKLDAEKRYAAKSRPGSARIIIWTWTEE